MDPLTHTLLGANLSATSLGDKTRFAAAALILGANAPDIDAVTYFIDSDLALGVRRGWTHGVLALLVLPIVLALLLALLARMKWGTRDFDVRWVLVLSAIGVWTHPFLDWLNTYGMRWLMPFDDTWFYGDAVYIMDPWLWLVLGVGWLSGRRPTFPLIALWLLFALLLSRIVARRSPEYLVVLAIVAVVLFATLMWRAGAEREGRSRRIATVALVVACGYVAARLGISEATEARVFRQLSEQAAIEEVMVSPDPIDPTKWRFVADAEPEYQYGAFSWIHEPHLTLSPETVPKAPPAPGCAEARTHPSVQGLVTWARFPTCEVERRGSETLVHLYDARRGGRGELGARTVVLPPG